MRVLVFGRSGQVAQALARFPDVTTIGRDGADFRNPTRACGAISSHKPDIVINAAAFTDVDGAEATPALAHQMNALTPGYLASACAERGIPFVQISSDYVFDGSGERPWRPEDETGPINAYGTSKHEGECAVRDAGGCHAILRTSWVFSASGQNFVTTIARLAQSRERLNIVDDLIGGPTPAADLAAACLEVGRQLKRDPGKSGVYHFAGTPDVSWHELACALKEHAGLKTEILPVPSTAFPRPARRPLNSRLDCSATRETFGLDRPDWTHALREVLQEIKEVA